MFIVTKFQKSNQFKTDCFFVLNIFFLFFFFSCKDSSNFKKDEKPIARVGDAYLYPSDLNEDILNVADKNDSNEIKTRYINDWIRERLLLQKAQNNLEVDKLKIDKMTENYRNSLITYRYESELIRQKLDTVVSDEEIESYYQSNKNNFELKDNIIKSIYIKVRKNAPKVEKLKVWYKSNDEKDKNALASYCYEYANNFFLDENTWLLFDNVLKEIPIKLYDKEAFLQNNRIIEIQDSAYLYLVNIKGFLIKNSISPLAFEKNNIRSIILNKRKVSLTKKMREEIYNEALKANLFDIYTK